MLVRYAVPGPSPMPTVLVYRNELLPVSETFIQKQVSEVKHFDCRYIGLRRYHPSLPFSEPPLLLSGGNAGARVRGLLYKATGIAPQFHRKAKSLDADLLHAHFAVDGANALSLARAIGRPMIVTLHGNGVTTTE